MFPTVIPTALTARISPAGCAFQGPFQRNPEANHQENQDPREHPFRRPHDSSSLFRGRRVT